MIQCSMELEFESYSEAGEADDELTDGGCCSGGGSTGGTIEISCSD